MNRGAMNIPRAARFLSEYEPNRQSQQDALDDLEGELLDDPGFESEVPEHGFEERG
jgi:hypothetical protein